MRISPEEAPDSGRRYIANRQKFERPWAADFIELTVSHTRQKTSSPTP